MIKEQIEKRQDATDETIQHLNWAFNVNLERKMWDIGKYSHSGQYIITQRWFGLITEDTLEKLNVLGFELEYITTHENHISLIVQDRRKELYKI